MRWGYKRLKDVAAINQRTLQASTDPDYQFSYLEISNVDYFGIVDANAIETLRFEDAPSRARRVVPADSTVISSVRPNLQAAAYFPHARADFICSTGFNVVEPIAKLLVPAFAYFCLISDRTRQHYEAVATGVGYPAVSDKEFGRLIIPLPSADEQLRIAAYLDASCRAVDSAVTAKQVQIDLLAQSFKATLQRIITCGLDSAPAFRKTDSPWLDKVPRHWNLVMLKRLCDIQPGLTLGKEYQGALVERPYLRVANVQDGHVLLDDLSTIEVPRSVAARTLLRVGDVLMTEGGDLDKLGRGVVWQAEVADCLHQNHVFAIRCRKWKLRPHFLAYVSAAQYGRDYFEATGKKTTNLAATNSTKVGQFPIPLPPVNEQDDLIAYLDRESERARELRLLLEQQIDTLIRYRKSLIHECVTGQRRITDEDVNRVKAHVATLA